LKHCWSSGSANYFCYCQVSMCLGMMIITMMKGILWNQIIAIFVWSCYLLCNRSKRSSIKKNLGNKIICCNSLIDLRIASGYNYPNRYLVMEKREWDFLW
jgi:hypothetical protein